MFSVEYLRVCVECSVFRGHGRGVGVKEIRVRVWCQGLGGAGLCLVSGGQYAAVPRRASIQGAYTFVSL